MSEGVPSEPPRPVQPESSRSGLGDQLRRRVPDWLSRRVSSLRGQAVSPPEQIIPQPAGIDNPPADIGVPSSEQSDAVEAAVFAPTNTEAVVPVDLTAPAEQVVPAQPESVTPSQLGQQNVEEAVSIALTETGGQATQVQYGEVSPPDSVQPVNESTPPIPHTEPVDRNEVRIPEDLIRRLQSSNREDLISSLNIVRDTMPVREAATVLAHFSRENQTPAASLRSDEVFEAIAAALNRRRGNEGQPLNLTAEENQIMADLFSALQEKLPRVRQYQIDNRMVSGLHSFLNRNPELATLAEELVRKVGRPPTETLVNRVTAYAPTVPVTQVAQVIQAGERRAQEVVIGIDRFNFLSSVLTGLSAEQRQQILDGLNRYTQLEQGVERRRLLEAIFTSPSSDRLGSSLRNARINLDQLPQLLNDEAIINLVAVMLDRPG